MTEARAPFLRSIQLDGLLSFRPKSPVTPLTALNVLIGPNASGKSNFIEAFELLRATPTDLAGTIRTGGGVAEWLWKGELEGSGSPSAGLTTVLATNGTLPELRYSLEFTESGQRVEIVDEALEKTTPRKVGQEDVYFYYRFQRGHPAINMRVAPTNKKPGGSYVSRRLQRESLDPQQSVFSQRRDPDLYPEVTQVGEAFGRILTFREWSFGRSAQLRQPQAADLSPDLLLSDLRNLGLVLNNIEHGNRWSELNMHLRRFLPRFRHLTTRILGGHVQINLQEEGLRTPVPATRLSDGTIRFIALLAILLQPEVASLICLEEPELGLHPDAIALIADLLIEASTQTQLVVTTHSDALVSALTANVESVLVCESLASATTLRRLDSEKLSFWLEKYRLGEVWRMGKLGGNT